MPGPVEELHFLGDLQVKVPQSIVPPQPSGALPQLFVPHAAACVSGVQQVPADVPGVK
jgi:hypothetical protein